MDILAGMTVLEGQGMEGAGLSRLVALLEEDKLLEVDNLEIGRHFEVGKLLVVVDKLLPAFEVGVNIVYIVGFV